MACLYLVPCNTADNALCLSDQSPSQDLLNSLIQVWTDFQVTNPGYAPLIRLYNGDFVTTPFTINGNPALVYGCYHVVYFPDSLCNEWEVEVQGGSSTTLHYVQCNGVNHSQLVPGLTILTICAADGTTPYFSPSANTAVGATGNTCGSGTSCDCSSITLFPGIGDIPSRPADQLVVGTTLGYVPPSYTVYNPPSTISATESVSCNICVAALWVENCSTGDITEVYNPFYGIVGGDPTANNNWVTLVNGAYRPVLAFGNNDYFDAACYKITYAQFNSTIPGFINFTTADVQTFTTTIPVTGNFSDCTACGSSGGGSAFRLIDCTGTPTYYLTDNTSASGSLSAYINQTIIVTLPTTLTGLSHPVTTCVTVYRYTSSPGQSSHDLGVITPTLNCENCSPCYTITACNNPELSYSISTLNTDIPDIIDQCPGQCDGCLPTIYLSFPETTDPQCWTISRGCSGSEPVNISFYDNLVYTLGCSNSPCLACNSTCYKVTPCDGSPFIIISNPTTIGNGGILVLDEVVEAVVTVTSAGQPVVVIEGCMVITQLPDCNPINGVYPLFSPSTVEFDTPAVVHPNCDDCLEIINPIPGYKITRCDDPGIYFIASNDLSAVLGKVITGVTITNCNSTFSICSSIKENQCWIVSLWEVPGIFDVQYTAVLPNCNCCPGPCD